MGLREDDYELLRGPVGRVPNPFFSPPAIQYVSMGGRRAGERVGNPGWETPRGAHPESGPFTISYSGEETECATCGTPLYVGDRAYMSRGEVYCCAACARVRRNPEPTYEDLLLENPFFSPPAINYTSWGAPRPGVPAAAPYPMSLFGADRPFVPAPSTFHNPSMYGADRPFVPAPSTFHNPHYECVSCGAPTVGGTLCSSCHRHPGALDNPRQTYTEQLSERRCDGCGRGTGIVFAYGRHLCARCWEKSPERARALREAEIDPRRGAKNPKLHKKCLAGQHDFDPTTWRCRRKDCPALLDDPGQTHMFGFDAKADAEARLRERSSGQGEFFHGERNPHDPVGAWFRRGQVGPCPGCGEHGGMHESWCAARLDRCPKCWELTPCSKHRYVTPPSPGMNPRGRLKSAVAKKPKKRRRR